MRRSTILMALAFAFLAFGKTVSFAQLNLAWEEIGPNNTGNHVRALSVAGDGTVWAGSTGGGLWKSTTGGSSWTHVSGLADNLSVSSIAISGSNIFVGTGDLNFYKPDGLWLANWAIDSVSTLKEGFLKYTSKPGQGVFVSNDGGATWTHNNGTWGGSSVPYQGDFISIPQIASQSGRTLIASLKGLYYSDQNDLVTITKATGTPAFMNNPIVDVDFAASGVVYAATEDSVYRSTDNGASFGTALNGPTPALSIFPTAQVTPPYNRIGGDRIMMAVAPSNPNTIYLTGASDITGNCTGVWRSFDNGYTWTSISPYESATFKPCQTKGRYALTLGVPPTNEGVVFIGGQKMYQYSGNNGWQEAASHTYVAGASTRYVPIGQHAIAFDPNTDSTYYVGTDNEVVRTVNWGRTYSFRTKGINAGHLLSISASPNWKLLVDDQYNGLSLKDNSQTAITQQQFNTLSSAANTGGGRVRWSMARPNDFIVHNASDRGLKRSLTEGATLELFYSLPLLPLDSALGTDSLYIDRSDNAHEGGAVYDRSNGSPIIPWCFDEFIQPTSLANDTDIQNTPIYLYLCSGNFVWVCSNPFGPVDSLPRWNRISLDLIQNNIPGGKHEVFTAIVASEDADHDVYVGTNIGRIIRIHNANDPVNMGIATASTRIEDPSMPDRWITSLSIDPSNKNNLLVTYGAFANGDDRVYISNDAKAATPTFRSLQGNLPANLPVHSAAFYPDASKRVIILGTDEGVYSTTDDYNSGAVTWHDESFAVGKVPVTDIVYRPYYMEYTDASNYRYSPDNTLFIATDGRGAFKTSTLVATDPQHFAASGITLKAGPNPTINGSTVSFDLPSPTNVTINAFTVEGRPVAQLARDKKFGTGVSELQFNTKDLPAGMYLLKATFTNAKGEFSTDLRIVVVK
jgi:hypothetical protein